MKQFKTLVALVMCIAMLFTACPVLAAGYTAGTYTAEATGNNGPVKVSVTVTADAITDVVVTEHIETAGLSDKPIADIPAAIHAGVDSIFFSQKGKTSPLPTHTVNCYEKALAILLSE